MKRNDLLHVDKNIIIVLHFESVTVLKFYNLKA